MRYDVNKAAWDMSLPSGSFAGRTYHSATVVGRHIWVVGGMNAKYVFQDVHAFDLDTLEWQQITLKCALSCTLLCQEINHTVGR